MFVEDEQQVGLEHIVIAQDDIERSREKLANRVIAEVKENGRRNTDHDALMA